MLAQAAPGGEVLVHDLDGLLTSQGLDIRNRTYK